MTRVEWTSVAVRDIRNLREYIAKDSATYADRFVHKVVEAVERAATFPHIGRMVPEAGDESIREVLFRNYRVMYRVEETRLLVLTIMHAGRDLSQLSPKPWEFP